MKSKRKPGGVEVDTVQDLIGRPTSLSSLSVRQHESVNTNFVC